MFWKKQWKKRFSSKGEEKFEIPAYSKEGGRIKSLERQGGLTTSASYGGMGERELQIRMELLVDQMLSTQHSVFEPAKQLVGFAKVDQDRFLNSVEKLSHTSVELAFYFCQFAPPSLQLVDEENWDNWVAKLLVDYNKKGLDSAIDTMKKVDEYVQSLSHAPASVTFEEVSRILESFVMGLNGRKLNIENNEVIYSDTETIRLPEISTEFTKREDNFALYKAMAVHQWAQTWFGTWRMNIDALVKTYKDPERALALFHKLETIRLDACVERELPGVVRAMKKLCKNTANENLSKNWQRAIKKLSENDSSVQDTMFFLESVYKEKISPQEKIYQGTLKPRETWKTIQERLVVEKESLKDKLTDFQRELNKANSKNKDDKENEGFSVEKIKDESKPDGFKIELQFDNDSVEPPEEIQQLLESILQDLGEIPDDYLVTTNYDAYDDVSQNVDAEESQIIGVDDEDYIYDEWDHSRQKYRKEWCHLKEIPIRPVYDKFINNTLHKHRNLLKHLHRTFEALREDDKRIRRQPYGDDIDLDAIIEAFADTQIGLEASQNLFTKSRKVDRNIAVMFMIDMSGSTAGWVNEMEREALVLLCESLETLGDRYAIYGFSGVTHERCELYKIKEFEELYSEEVKARISGIKPQDYTRMGVAIRHLTKLLYQVEARTKLLITLSDGRPDDQDGYRGPYGIEDTRRALIEAKYLGIHPFCITIDKEAMDYLQHMYGAVNFAVIDQVDKLPYRVSDIYRRITV